MSKQMPVEIVKVAVVAADAESALRSVSRQMQKLDGVSTTGVVVSKSPKHLVWSVSIAVEEFADLDDAWVVMTSYGICPEQGFRSAWA